MPVEEGFDRSLADAGAIEECTAVADGMQRLGNKHWAHAASVGCSEYETRLPRQEGPG